MDASPLPAFKRFEIPLLGKIYFETGLSQEAADAAIHYTQGDFLHEVTPEQRSAFGMDRPRVFSGLVASGLRASGVPPRITPVVRSASRRSTEPDTTHSTRGSRSHC